MINAIITNNLPAVMLIKICHVFFVRVDDQNNLNLNDFFRLLKPLTPEYVAEEIVVGILTNQMTITLPPSIKFISLLKR